MLVSPEKREELRLRLATIKRPSELAGLASSLGVSIGTVFQMAAQEEATAAPGTIWLQVREGANRFTKQDVKLRIIAAHYDRARWFVPTNKSVSGLFGDSSWMSRISMGAERKSDNVVFSVHKIIMHNAVRKYQLEKLTGTVYAMVIRPFAGSTAPQYVLSVVIH